MHHAHSYHHTILVNVLFQISVARECGCCTRSARHGILFPFPLRTTLCCFSPDRLRYAVQARLCRKRCRHVFGLGSYLLSMTSSPSALVAVTGFYSFHFRFAPLISTSFAIRHWLTLYPAPLLPLDDNGSIAWSVCILVQYI